MKYLLAVFCPFAVFFLLKKPINAYFSLILSLFAIIASLAVFNSYNLLLVFWFLLVLWAFVEINEDNNRRNTKRIVKRAFNHQLKKSRDFQQYQKMESLLNNASITEQNKINYNTVIAANSAVDNLYYEADSAKYSLQENIAPNNSNLSKEKTQNRQVEKDVYFLDDDIKKDKKSNIKKSKKRPRYKKSNKTRKDDYFDDEVKYKTLVTRKKNTLNKANKQEQTYVRLADYYQKEEHELVPNKRPTHRTTNQQRNRDFDYYRGTDYTASRSTNVSNQSKISQNRRALKRNINYNDS